MALLHQGHQGLNQGNQLGSEGAANGPEELIKDFRTQALAGIMQG